MRRLLLPLLLLAFALPQVASAKPRRKPKKPKPTKPEPAEEEKEAETAPEPARPTTPPAANPAATDPAKPAAPAINAPPPPREGEGKAESAIDVDSLRKQYLELRDQLFRSRARAAALGSSLYSTRIRLHLDYKSGRFYTITRAVIRLDGANVYDDNQGAIAADSAPRFDGFVAPGRHQVTVRIEATGKDDQRFTTALESSFVVQAPSGKDVIVKCTAEDDGDIAYQWKKSEEGSYKLRLDVAIDTQKREAGGGKRAAR
ncbi:MAG TPA: hypothetical protein VFU21_10870 [Kofleriaceae bacterium]|nr:hypothetical protein [Kofleriaceae bacterium]